MAEKVDVWCNWGERQKAKGQNKQKAGSSGQSGKGQDLIGNKKPGWGKKGFGNAVQGKGARTADGALSSRFVATVVSRTNTQGQENQQNPNKKDLDVG